MSSQGFGCSPIKAARELGSERKLHCVLSQKCDKIKLTHNGETLLNFPNYSEGNAVGRSVYGNNFVYNKILYCWVFGW